MPSAILPCRQLWEQPAGSAKPRDGRVYAEAEESKTTHPLPAAGYRRWTKSAGLKPDDCRPGLPRALPPRVKPAHAGSDLLREMILRAANETARLIGALVLPLARKDASSPCPEPSR
jgi:hypothetical protein